jgi:hypothetical protein
MDFVRAGKSRVSVAIDLRQIEFASRIASKTQ